MKYPQVVSMPSAVSNWLEEQLEARGIDSEVYTHYILSLLHVHALDVICPEDDFSFVQLKKDGGRSTVSNKRIRRTGTWWRHAHADAEQIKRSAAVECLMSAAEQSCEIESLVDELCEKLKKVDSEAELSPIKSNEIPKQETTRQQKVSPKELAEKYYAAFPPLNQKNGNSYITSNINLVTEKWPSPKKSLGKIDLITAKWTSGSPKKAKRKTRRQEVDTNIKWTRTSQNKNKLAGRKVSCVRNLSREMEESESHWHFFCKYTNSDNAKDINMNSLPPISVKVPSPAFPVSAYYLIHQKAVETFKFEAEGVSVAPKKVLNTYLMEPSASKIWSPSRRVLTKDLFRNGDYWFQFVSEDGTLVHNTNNYLEKLRTKSSRGWETLMINRVINNVMTNIEQERSAFARYVACRNSDNPHEPQPYSRCFGKPMNRPPMPDHVVPKKRESPQYSPRRPSEDLWGAPHLYFRPIKSPTTDISHEDVNICYEDGSTFQIDSSLQEVNYQRTMTGQLYLQTDFGEEKFYQSYFPTSNHDGVSLSSLQIPDRHEFVVKFHVKQNDKACQTSDEYVGLLTTCKNNEAQLFFTTAADYINYVFSSDYNPKTCEVSEDCGEDLSQYHHFLIDFFMEALLIENLESLVDDPAKIAWNSAQLNSGIFMLPSSLSQMRKENARDGDVLLQELDEVQRNYSESLKESSNSLEEEKGTIGQESSEQKYRPSFVDNDTEIWSFATRLQEDCLINLSILPTLRSVTL